MKTLNDYFPQAIEGNGIFTEIAKIEWFEGLDPKSFDMYFSLKCGDKFGATTLKPFLSENDIVEGAKLTKLAKLIYNINKISWKNIYRDLTVEYNPIENTDYIETVKEKGTSTGSGSTESSGSNGSTGTTTNNKYAFNSATAVPDTIIGNQTSDTASATTETETQGQTENEKELRKHGNIGVVTNADMIISDLSVWQNKIADLFIKDICDIIALSIY